MKPPLQEQRTHTRVDSILPVRFRDAQEFLTEYAQNISAGGLYIRTKQVVSRGREIRLNLELPESRTVIPCVAKVVFTLHEDGTGASGMGLRFVSLDPAARRVIESFVEFLDQRQRATLLVVDDEPAVLGLLTERLRRNRFNVLTATDGQHALQVVETNAVDVILSDLDMPNLGGMDLRRELLKDERTKAIPFIVLTGNEEPDHAAAAELGVQAFLAKPVETTRLVEVLSQAIVSLDEKSPRPARMSQEAATAAAAMRRVGIEITSGEGAQHAEGTYVFTRSEVVHPGSLVAVPSAQFRSLGSRDVVFQAPEFMTCLSPIRLTNLVDAGDFEQTVVAALQERMEWIEMGRGVLRGLGVEVNMYTPGFCVLGSVFVGDHDFILSVRDPQTIVVEAMSGRSVVPAVPGEVAVIDLTLSGTKGALEAALMALAAEHGDTILNGDAGIRFRPQPGGTEDPFSGLDELLGAAADVEAGLLWIDASRLGDMRKEG